MSKPYWIMEGGRIVDMAETLEKGEFAYHFFVDAHKEDLSKKTTRKKREFRLYKVEDITPERIQEDS